MVFGDPLLAWAVALCGALDWAMCIAWKSFSFNVYIIEVPHPSIILGMGMSMLSS
jgi:hypothetical protein